MMKQIEFNTDIEPCVSVVIPVRQEAGTIEDVINLILVQSSFCRYMSSSPC